MPVLKNNCYFLHLENILLAAVSDSDQVVCRLATQRILTSLSLLSHLSDEQLTYDHLFILYHTVPFISCRKGNLSYNCSQFKSL